MPYKEVTSLNCDTVYALGGVDNTTGKANPTTIEGYYLGSRPSKPGEEDSSLIHVFQTKKGNEGIWGAADTNSKLTSKIVGQMTKVTFLKKMKITGGKTKKLYTVQTDSTNSLSSDVGSDLGGSTYEDNGYDDVGYDEGDEAQEQLPLRKSSSAAEVEALLKGSGSRKN